MENNIFEVLNNWQLLIGIISAIAGGAWFISSQMRSIEKNLSEKINQTEIRLERRINDTENKVASIEGFLKAKFGEK